MVNRIDASASVSQANVTVIAQNNVQNVTVDSLLALIQQGKGQEAASTIDKLPPQVMHESGQIERLFFAAAAKGTKPVVDALFSTIDVRSVMAESQQTPLMVVLEHRWTDCAWALIRRGAPLTSCDSSKHSALFYLTNYVDHGIIKDRLCTEEFFSNWDVTSPVTQELFRFLIATNQPEQMNFLIEKTRKMNPTWWQEGVAQSTKGIEGPLLLLVVAYKKEAVQAIRKCKEEQCIYGYSPTLIMEYIKNKGACEQAQKAFQSKGFDVNKCMQKLLTNSNLSQRNAAAFAFLSCSYDQCHYVELFKKAALPPALLSSSFPVFEQFFYNLQSGNYLRVNPLLNLFEGEQIRLLASYLPVETHASFQLVSSLADSPLGDNLFPLIDRICAAHPDWWVNNQIWRTDLCIGFLGTGNTKVARILVERGALDVTRYAQEGRQSLLMLAAEYGDEKMVRSLLQQKAKLTDVDANRKSAFSYIQKYCSAAFVQEVIEDQYRTDASLYEETTPGMLLELCSSKNGKLAMQLLERISALAKAPTWLQAANVENSTLIEVFVRYAKANKEESERCARIATSLQISSGYAAQLLELAIEQKWQAAVKTLYQRQGEILWTVCSASFLIKREREICATWKEPFLCEIYDGFNVEEKWVLRVIEAATLEKSSVADLLIEKLAKINPAWWQKKGCKEDLFRSLISVAGIPQKRLITMATLIDVQYDFSANGPHPVIAAAIAGNTEVVKKLIDRGLDLSKVPNYNNKSVFEYVEEVCRADDAFVAKVLESCSVESLTWLKNYSKILSLLSQKKNDEALALVVQGMHGTTNRPQWVNEPARLWSIYQRAYAADARSVVQLVAAKMAVSDHDPQQVIRDLHAKQWHDVTLQLLQNDTLAGLAMSLMSREIVRTYKDNSSFMNQLITACPVEKPITGKIIKELLLSEQIERASQLLERLLGTTPVPTWADGNARHSIFRDAGNSAKELAKRVVKGFESLPFEGEESFLSHAVEAAWADVAGELITKGADCSSVFESMYDQLNALSNDFISIALQQCVVDEEGALKIFRSLIAHNNEQAVDQFYKRLTSESANLPWVKTTKFITNLLIPFSKSQTWDTFTLELMKQGADLSLRYSDGTTVLRGIEKSRNKQYVSSLLQQMVLAPASSIDLLEDLLQRDKNEEATALVSRIKALQGKEAWFKEVPHASLIFIKMIVLNKPSRAQEFVEFITQPVTVNDIPLLAFMAGRCRGVEWEALAQQLIKQKLPFYAEGSNSFQQIKKAFPKLAATLLETYPLDKEVCILFRNFSRYHMHEDAYALYSRICAAAPRWLTGQAKAEFFFDCVTCSGDKKVKAIIESLLHDAPFDYKARNSNGKTPLMLAIDSVLDPELVTKMITGGGDEQLLYRDAQGNSCFALLLQKPDLASVLIENNTLYRFLNRIGIYGVSSLTQVQEAITAKTNPTGTGFSYSVAAVMNETTAIKNKLSTLSFRDKYYIFMPFLRPEVLTREYEGMFHNAAFSVEPSHYTTITIPKSITITDTTISLDAVKAFYTQFSTKADDAPYIDTFIKRIKERTADVATPSESGAREEFFQNIQNQVLAVIEHFKQAMESTLKRCAATSLTEAAATDAEAQALLTQIREWLHTAAKAAPYCAARLQDHAREYYMRLVMKKNYDMKTMVHADLAEFRTLLVQSYVSGYEQSVHAFNCFLIEHGEALGLPGAAEAKKAGDKWFAEHRGHVADAKRKFDKNYTPAMLVEHMRFIFQENHLKYVDFLGQLTSQERQALEPVLLQVLQGKIAQKWDNDAPLESNQKKIREFLEAAPYYINLEDSDYTSKQAISAALARTEYKSRHIYALTDHSGAGGYPWEGVVLTLLALGVLK